MNAHRSILFAAFLLAAGLTGADDGKPALLRLALSPRAAEAVANARLPLAPPVELDVAAWEKEEAEEAEAEIQTFFPHASQVRIETREVNAHELIKREMFRIHGSISIGINSRGGWETSLELHRNLTPYLQLGVGLSIGRGRTWWDSDW